VYVFLFARVACPISPVCHIDNDVRAVPREVLKLKEEKGAAAATDCACAGQSLGVSYTKTYLKKPSTSPSLTANLLDESIS
jgi:hypothetical protein